MSLAWEKFKNYSYRAYKCVTVKGPMYSARRLKFYLVQHHKRAQICNRHEISAKERFDQENYDFPKKITFSILVPLYNTKKEFLDDLIQSVQKQTYPHWELCLADASDDPSVGVEKNVAAYMKHDHRIRYTQIPNLGISENTNECMKLATGDYFSLLDHDDVLHPSALFYVMKAICEEDADFIYTDEASFESPDLSKLVTMNFKPDFSPDYLCGVNYICHLTTFSRELQQQVGEFRPECNGSQDYDMILRLTEKAKHIVHIPKLLYFWRIHPQSTAGGVEAKPYCISAAIRALEDHYKRLGIQATVEESGIMPTTYRTHFAIIGEPLISIIIPNKDNIDTLETCVSSILNLSTYKNYEILVVENNSEEDKTFQYYEELKKRDSRIQVITYQGSFNYSKINNFAVQYAKGEHLLFLNNDTQVIAPDWLQEMLGYSQREDVGGVGAKLNYPDDTIQHAGVVVGLGGYAAHAHRNFTRESVGYIYRIILPNNFSACTAACLMMKKSVFLEVGGFTEEFTVAYNDVDLCLKVRETNRYIVYTPYAELYHYESKTRGDDNADSEKTKRFNREKALFAKRWHDILEKGDPFYNVNLTLSAEDFSLR